MTKFRSEIETLQKMSIPGQEHKEAADCLFLAAIVCLILVIALSFIGCGQDNGRPGNDPDGYYFILDPNGVVAAFWTRKTKEPGYYNGNQSTWDYLGCDPNGRMCVRWIGPGECWIYQDGNQVAYGDAGEVCFD